jgi:hypothetical protein
MLPPGRRACLGTQGGAMSRPCSHSGSAAASLVSSHSTRVGPSMRAPASGSSAPRRHVRRARVNADQGTATLDERARQAHTIGLVRAGKVPRWLAFGPFHENVGHRSRRHRLDAQVETDAVLPLRVRPITWAIADPSADRRVRYLQHERVAGRQQHPWVAGASLDDRSRRRRHLRPLLRRRQDRSDDGGAVLIVLPLGRRSRDGVPAARAVECRCGRRRRRGR